MFNALKTRLAGDTDDESGGSDDADDATDPVVTPADTDLDVEAAFTVLSNARRRHVIMHVARDLDDGDDVSLSDLVEHIAAIEHGPVYTTQERKAVYVGMYQAHIDDLVDAGVLIREGSHLFQAGPTAETLADVIDAMHTAADADAEAEA